MFSPKPTIFLATLCLSFFSLAACQSEPADDTTTDNSPPATVNMNDNNESPQRYGVKSGIVKYSVTSDMMSGTEELYFDDWGRQEAKYTKLSISIPGMPAGAGEQDQAVYMRDGHLYNVDRTTNRGTKAEDIISQKMMAESDSDSMYEVGEKMMRAMNAVKKGEDTVGGYDCVLWEIAEVGSTACAHKGVTLRADTNMGGLSMRYEATEVQFDVAVPADKLAVPTDVQWQEVDMEKVLQQVQDL